MNTYGAYNEELNALMGETHDSKYKCAEFTIRILFETCDGLSKSPCIILFLLQRHYNVVQYMIATYNERNDIKAVQEISTKFNLYSEWAKKREQEQIQTMDLPTQTKYWKSVWDMKKYMIKNIRVPYESEEYTILMQKILSHTHQ